MMLGLVLATGGCAAGSDEPVQPAESSQVQESGSDDAAKPLNSPAHTEDAIRAHLGLDESGYVTADGTKCEASVILTSAAQLDLYSEAGDPVAYNNDHNAGVKIGEDPDGTCGMYFMETLADL